MVRPVSRSSAMPAVPALRRSGFPRSSQNTRFGGNNFHGALFEYFRNEELGANDWFANRDGVARPPLKYHDFGGALGGPVRIPHLYNGHDKTFFFFNFEQYKTFTIVNGTPLETVPTAAYRQGNFSGALTGRTLGTDPTGAAILENTIYDPTTNFAASNGSIVRTPFPGNIIPSSRIDPAAAKIQEGDVILQFNDVSVESDAHLVNLVSLPMGICSGVFFSAGRFPEVFQPLIKALPLTALIEGVRAVMLGGAGLAAVAQHIAILLVWGAVSFAVALRLFRWR